MIQLLENSRKYKLWWQKADEKLLRTVRQAVGIRHNEDQETFGSDRQVHSLNCGDRFTGACMLQLISFYPLYMCKFIVCELHFNKAAFYT